MIHNLPPQGGHNPPLQEDQTVLITNPNSQIITSNPQQYGGNVIFQQAPPIAQGNRYAHFKNRFCAGLGITQIIIGVLCIVMNIVIYVDRYQTYFFFMSHGTWGGIFFIITGSLGTAAGSTKNTCLIVTFMVMSIIAVSFPTPYMLIISAIDVSLIANNYYYYNHYDYYYHEEPDVGLAMESIILILSVLELVIGIISAAVCCHAVCCCKSTGGVWSNQSMGYVYNQNQQPANIHYSGVQYIAPSSTATSYQAVPMYLQQPQCMTYQTDMCQQQPQAIAAQPPVYEKQPQGMDQQPPVYQEKP